MRRSGSHRAPHPRPTPRRSASAACRRASLHGPVQPGAIHFCARHCSEALAQNAALAGTVPVEQSGRPGERAIGSRKCANPPRRKGSSVLQEVCYAEETSCSFLFHATLCFVLFKYTVPHTAEKCM